MKCGRAYLASLIVIALISLTVHAADAPTNLPFTSGEMRSLSDALSLDGVAGFVQGRAREAIRFALSKEGASWMCDAIADAINAQKKGEVGFDLAALFWQDEALKLQVKENIKQRLKAWLPEQIKDVVANQLLGAAVGEENLEEARRIAERVEQELDTSLNERIDAIVGNLYDSTMQRARQKLMERGISQWLDMSDLSGSIERAFDTSTITELATSEISRLVGDGVVLGIRGRIEDALNGKLPPEVVQALKTGPKEFEKYISQVQEYLPGNQLDELTSSVLNKPFIKLPTPAYASILAASAAAHYARAFKGMYVDAYELKRAVEVTRVMVWQLKNKKWISLTLFQIGNLARDIAEAFGAGAVFNNIMDQIKKPLKRVQDLTNKIDELLLKPVNQVRSELEKITQQLQQELKSLQEELISPIRDELENTKGWIQDELDQARWNIENALPEGFNGIPGSWEDAKDALGLEDGVLGELGDITPKDILKEAARKAGLDDAYDKMTDGIATAASEALEGLHLLSPAAEILDVERVPSRNPSEQSALDPVLLHNGEYVQKVTDLVIPGRGIHFRFTRTYRGRSEFLGELGWRWTHSYAERLHPWKDGLTYIDEEGRKFFFEKSASGYVSPPGIYANLVYQRGSGFALYRRDGSVTTFDGLGRPRFKQDRHKNRIIYEYDKGGLLTAVVDVFGRRVRFGRRDDGLISEIKDFVGRTISFQYNDAKELISVTSPASADFSKGKKTSYRYTSAEKGPAHVISMIMDPMGRVWLRLRYDERGRVIAQRHGDGPWMRVSYGEGSGDVAGRTWVTDQLGVVRLYEHDLAGHLLRRWRYDGSDYALLGSYHYNSDGERTRQCLPSGRCMAFKYGKGPSASLLEEINEIPNNGKKPRITRIEHEQKYGRISRIDFPTGVSEQVEFADDEIADPKAVFQTGKGSDKWKKVAAYSFNEFGQLISEKDAEGAITTYEYYPAQDPDGDGVLISSNEGAETGGYLKNLTHHDQDATTSFEYDPIGNITARTDPLGNKTKYFVNSLNQILREERQGLWPVRYSFDANDNLVSVEIERPNNPIVHTLEYSALDKLVAKKEQVKSGKHITTQFIYDRAGRLARITKPEGNSVDYEYGPEGHILCIIKAAGTLERSRECVEHDKDGNIIAHVDGSGVRTKYELNSFGETAAQIDALGNRTKYERDNAGRINKIKRLDADRHLLAEGRLFYEGGLLAKRSQRLWRDDPAKSRWVETSLEDEAGPHGIKREIVRDKLGRPIQTYVKSNDKKLDLEQIAYDEAGRVSQYNRGWDRPRRYEYDGQGNLLRIEDPARGPIAFEPDDLGRKTKVTQGEATTEFAWDGNGRLVQITDANGNTTEFGYDDLDRLVLERFADGSIRRTSYDAAGRVVGINGRGRMLTIAYDAAGRLASREARTKETRSIQRFEYDGMGRLISAQDGEVISRFVYDSLSRPVAESVGTRWIARGFDDANRVISLRLPDGETFFNYYTPAGNLKAVMGNGGRIASFEHDALGNIIGQKLAGRLALLLERDDWGREIARQYTTSAGKPVAEWKYELDGGGRVRTEHDSLTGVSRKYVRDSIGRLVGVDVNSRRRWTYEYDLVGNILKATDGNNVKRMKYNELNQVDSLKYDSNGNLISDGLWRYDYDPWGRLITVHQGQELMARYKYDAFDRRVKESFADILHENIWDGWRLIHVDAINDATQSFVYSDMLGPPLASIASGFPSLLITDRTGSVRGMDGIDNELTDRCDFGPYGEGLGCQGLFGYAGQLRGAEGRLTYMRYRNYDPELMRFISPDPLGYKIEHYYNDDSWFGPALSYHISQGAASRASIPNHPLLASPSYDAYPFGRLFSGLAQSAFQGEMGLYIYAGGDPSAYWDPFGLARLIFERSKNRMVLEDENGWEVSIYEVANRAVNPKGDPLVIGSNGPFPNGTFSLSVPEFYTKAYRDRFYERFGLGLPKQGESLVSGPGWRGTREDGYNISQGLIRVRAGSPTSGVDLTAWRRQLFIHGGRYNKPTSPTYGCIRARDDELETLAANFIAFRRQGDPITELIVR